MTQCTIPSNLQFVNACAWFLAATAALEVQMSVCLCVCMCVRHTCYSCTGLLKDFRRTPKDFWRTSEGLQRTLDFIAYKIFTSRSPQVFETCFLGFLSYDSILKCLCQIWCCNIQWCREDQDKWVHIFQAARHECWCSTNSLLQSQVCVYCTIQHRHSPPDKYPQDNAWKGY